MKLECLNNVRKNSKLNSMVRSVDDITRHSWMGFFRIESNLLGEIIADFEPLALVEN